MLRALSLFLLFTFACSCGNKMTMAKQLGKVNRPDSATILKYTEKELDIISGLDSIFACRVEKTCFNGCVLVAKKGRIIYRKAMGFADHGTKKMLNLNSSFQLASASKPFTATAVLMLAEEGKLKLDDTLQKFIPKFPYKGITVRMLLCHRSGLPNYMYFAGDYFTDSDTPLSNEQVINCMISNKPARHDPPGKKFEYCNTNYCLLASIIEKASGVKYADFIQKNIFDALNMKNSFVLDLVNGKDDREHTKGYEGSKWKDAEVNMLDGVLGDKNIFSSVYDMFIFDRALYTGKLLKPATLAEAYKGYSHEKPGARNYGLGWRLMEKRGERKIIYHNGWWHGYNSLFFRRPDDETVIIVLCNHNNKSTYQVKDLLQVLDNDTASSDLEKEE